MDIKILQWNINGFYNNLHELQLLVHQHSPVIIALQETHHQSSNLLKLNGYVSYASICNTNRSGGTAIFLKNNLKHHIINITQYYVEIVIHLQIKIKLISLYLNPSEPLPLTVLSTMLTCNNQNTIILGDFNAHSRLWGSPNTNHRGSLIENILTNSNLILLNDGRPTHFSTRSIFTHIDLTFISPDLAPITTWNINNYLHSSDHFPIHINILRNINSNVNCCLKTTRYNTDKGNWTKFQNILENIPSNYSSNNPNKEAARILKIIRSAANMSIPQLSGYKKYKFSYWWSTELHSLRDSKQNLFDIFYKHPITENMLAYKKSKALFKYKSKIAKSESFFSFTQQINPNTSTKQIWSNVSRLGGSHNSNKINFIKFNNSTFSDVTEIANLFAESWSNQSNDCNFSDEFKKLKKAINAIPNYDLNQNTKIL